MPKEEEVSKINYPLEIDKNRWETFKNFIPRTMTINDRLIELIEEFITRTQNNETTKPVTLTKDEWEHMFDTTKTESPSKAVKNLIERLL